MDRALANLLAPVEDFDGEGSRARAIESQGRLVGIGLSVVDRRLGDPGPLSFDHEVVRGSIVGLHDAAAPHVDREASLPDAWRSWSEPKLEGLLILRQFRLVRAAGAGEREQECCQ